jgi:predicted amidophosphoribosyltransferase
MTGAAYPEHEKLKAVRDRSQCVGEFLEWLAEKGLYVVHLLKRVKCKSCGGDLELDVDDLCRECALDGDGLCDNCGRELDDDGLCKNCGEGTDRGE